MLVGALAVAAWAAASGRSLAAGPGNRRNLFLLGAMFWAQIVLLNVGTDFTSAAYAVTLLNAYPVFTNLIGHFFDPGAKLRPAHLLGLGLAFSGIVYVAFGKPEASLARAPLAGNLCMVASAVLLGIRSVYTRRLVQSIDPVTAVVWMMGWSVPLFLIPALLFEPMLIAPLTIPPVLAILYQAIIVAGFCFIVWTRLLKRHSAGNVTTFGFSVPIFGILLSWLVFAEPLSSRLFAGIGLVTAGILIVTRRRR